MATHAQRGQALIEVLLFCLFLVGFVLSTAALSATAIDSQAKFRFGGNAASTLRFRSSK